MSATDVISSQPQPRLNASTGSFAKNGAWVTACRVLGVSLTFFINGMLTRVMTRADYGAFVALQTFVTFAAIVSQAGLNRMIIRAVGARLAHQDPNGAWVAFRGFSLLLAPWSVLSAILQTYLLIYIGRRWWSLEINAPLACAVGATIVVFAVLQYLAESLRAFRDVVGASMITGLWGGAVSNLTFMVFIAGASAFGRSSLTEFTTLCALSGLVWTPYFFYRLWIRSRANLSPSEPMGRDASWLSDTLSAVQMMFIQLFMMSAHALDPMIAAAWAEKSELALFGAARRLSLIVSMPLLLVNQTILSSIAELHALGKTRELQRVLQRGALAAAIPSVAVTLLMLFAPRAVLGAIYGLEYQQAAMFLVIMNIGGLFNVLTGTCSLTLSMTGWESVSLLINTVSAVCAIAGGSAAAAHFGLIGLAINSTICLSAATLAHWILAKKLVGVWTHPGW